MRFLIDGSAFSLAGYSDEAEFWQKVLPTLASELAPHELFFLERGVLPHREQFNSARVLKAPPPEHTTPGVEERRLHRLCRNMGIDAMASTAYTTPGTLTPSVFVLARRLPYLEQKDLPVAVARDVAIRSASLCIALDQAGVDYLRAGYSMPAERVRTVAAEDSAPLARQLASSLVSAATIPPPLRETDAPPMPTRQELIAQFEAPAVKAIVERVSADPRCRDLADAVHVLAWHGLTHHPKVYVEFGMTDVPLASVACQLCQGIEIFGSAAIPRPPMPGRPSPSFDTVFWVQALPKTSLCRYAIASPSDLVADLVQQSPNRFQADFVTVRPEASSDDALTQIRAIEPYLSPTAAMLLCAPPGMPFSLLHDRVCQARPDLLTFQMKQRTAALLLKKR